MKIISLDLGTNTGWCYLDSTNNFKQSGFWEEKSYLKWANHFKDILDTWKPEMIVCSQTNSYGHFNATRKMYMLFGITCYLSEKLEIPVVEFNDSSARKALFGNGRLKKPEAHEKLVEMDGSYDIATGDEKDAIILALGWEILNQEDV